MKRLLYALLVLGLFAPVYLCIGSSAFRPPRLSARIATVPVSVWVVIGLIAVFVGLAWAFSGSAFEADEDVT